MSVKQLIPLKLKQMINSYVAKPNINGDLHSAKNKIFIGLAADYGNLGDVAISYAQYHFLKNNFPDYEIIDVPISQTLANIRAIKTVISADDIITTVGGGNLTNQYQEIEDFRLILLKEFPHNRFISFPQTIDFSDDKLGQQALKRSFDLYNNHKNFIMFARESVSLDKMNTLLKQPALFCPDIVLTLDKSESDNHAASERSGIVSCIRNDGESNLSKYDRAALLANIAQLYGDNVTFTDTHIDSSQLSWQQRTDELNIIWSRFRGAKLVVTDRLHGMIFSVITKTPCVVLTNSNHKILQTYKNWLSDLNHLALVENYQLETVLEEIERLLAIPREAVKLPQLSDKYNVLLKAISAEQ
ncbi:MAG: polysaccharide pyruvyl transferase family protein [Thalassotalea sp.]